MGDSDPTDIYSFTVEDISGRDFNMSQYKNCVVIIVNVASASEYADRDYTQLQELYEKYADRGLRVVAFPCNQFDALETKSNAAIRVFAKRKHASFDLCAKIDVTGDEAIPLFTFLREHDNTPGEIPGNFTKFLVDRKGIPRHRFGEHVEPLGITSYIENLLDE